MFRKKISLLLLVVMFLPSCFILNKSQQSETKVKGCLSHIVNIGEDLPSLLLRYEVLTADLKKYNSTIGYDLTPGGIVYIPKNAIGKASQSDLRADIESIRASREQKKKDLEVENFENNSILRPKYSKHVVEHGQTFYSISKLHGITVAELESHNRGVNKTTLSVGATLNIPNKINKATTTFNGSNTSFSGDYKRISFDEGKDNLKISLILPLVDDKDVQSDNFTEFYQGFLVGLDSLRNEGMNIALNVINSDKGTIVADRISYTQELSGSDIIIGPVYDEQFCKVAQYAAMNSIPIVSPLAKVSCGNAFVFQVAPEDNTKYDKLKDIVTDKNVILLSTDSDDAEFVATMNRFCAGAVKVVPFNVKASPNSFIRHLSSSRENVFLVAATNEQQADGVISKIGSIKTFAGALKVSSIASTKIARMETIDPSILYNADLSYITSYHSDRNNKKVRNFDGKYMTLFGDTPSLYSYRGYDVALFFGGSMKEFGEDLTYYIDDYRTSILQVAYKFNRGDNGKFVNEEWMLVNYTPQYEIEVK